MKRYHWGIKILAFFLAASALVICVGSAALALDIYYGGLYTQPPAEVMEAYREEQAMNLAHKILQRHAATQLGQCSQAILDYTDRGYTNQELSKIFDWCNPGQYSLESLESIDPAVWRHAAAVFCGQDS